MRKHFVMVIVILTVSITVKAQTRGVKIGYIDMEYILQNVPDYKNSVDQLEQKAQKWKLDIDSKKNDITKLKEALKIERVLLTKELIEEREEEITFQETELLDYQNKRFGPNGDLIIQKGLLTQPIQDQVFTAAQDIAVSKKYDFIFDKSSDLTMLFAAKRYDISDQVVRVISRSTQRGQLNKKQLKAEEIKEANEDIVDQNPNLVQRQKALDEKKIARDQLIESRKLAAEEKKKAFEDKRLQMLADKEAKRTVVPTTALKEDKGAVADKLSAEKTKTTVDSTAIKARQKTADERTKTLEARKKAAEDKKNKILSDRLEKSKEVTKPEIVKEVNKTIEKEVLKGVDSTAIKTRQKAAENRLKTIEARKKIIEDKKNNKIEESKITSKTEIVKIEKKDSILSEKIEKKGIDSISLNPREKAAQERSKTLEARKKAIEDKKKKVLEDREAAKKAKEDKLKENQ